ncbi:unnamed protein product [Musa acuminata subsp. burmannicoides]
MLFGLTGGFDGVTMPTADFQGSSVPFAFSALSILSFRYDHPVNPPVDTHQCNHDACGEQRELVAFQRQVADLFHDLAAGDDEILSVAWMRRLLDTFLVCQEEFRVVLFGHHRSPVPVDRLVSDFFDRAVKALDVCNAVRDGVDQMRHWRKHLEIVLVALGPQQQHLGEGQLRRAKKALAEVAILMFDEKDVSSVPSHNGGLPSSSSSGDRSSHFRSLSCTVSRSWSAARLLQAIGSNLIAPRRNEVVATAGLAVPMYTMSSVLLFVMWALVAAIPCQDRGPQINFSIPRSFLWAAPIMSLHERILEESKKKDRKHSAGLLKEIEKIDKCVHHLRELIDAVQFPMTEEEEVEVMQGVQELAQVCEVLKEGLDPVERQVREVFVRIVRSRKEGLDGLLNGAE